MFGLNQVEIEEAFYYLDEVRQMGSLNMLGAAAPLAASMCWDKGLARSVLTLWMETFSEEPAYIRAQKVLAK